MKHYILIDASYFIFYRLFALVNWWKLSHKDEPCVDLHENPEFVDKFKSVFVRKLEELPKKLNVPKGDPFQIIVGTDCPRKDIWRMELFPSYKGTRNDYSTAKIKPGPFFKIAYSENLFHNSKFGNMIQLKHPRLEADDCIALCTSYIQNNAKEPYHIKIITSDTDYLQLCCENVSLYKLNFKPVKTEKNSLQDKNKDLLYKIIVGDKSDNIPALFGRNYKKRALHYCDHPKELVELFDSDEDLYIMYKLNRTLIDFTKIPEEYKTHMNTIIDSELTK